MPIAQYASRSHKTPVVYGRMQNPNKPPSRQKQQVTNTKNRKGNELRGSKVELGSSVRLQSSKGRDLHNNQRIKNKKAKSWTLTDTGAAKY